MNRLFLIFPVLACGVAAAENEDPFRTFFVTRSMTHEQLLPYLEAAKPEIVQIGQYGAMFHGYADDEKSKGTPMQLPIRGERAVLEFQRDLNRKIRDLGLKVVGHFRLVKAYGNWEEKTGFIDYYENRWPEDLLGPKPHDDLIELLQRNSKGEPVGISRYGQGQIAFCLSSPFARQMFKQMLKVAVDHGVDGVITTYNYHLGCSCPHCRESFDAWLDQRDLEFEYEEIPARISGHPDPAEATELDWVAMRWAAENFKKNFDDIFINYGRELKPELIVAQWNHLSNVSAGEERMFLPIEQWGIGENYFWESGGARFAPKNLDLANRQAGDAWLSQLVMHELGGGKPVIMGNYDGLRLEASMAQGFANDGPGMGRYMRFEDPHGFEVLERYTNFMHRNRHLYDGAEPVRPIGLILPRQALWEGKVEAFDEFRAIGQALLEAQIPLDIIADENISGERLRNCAKLFVPESAVLTEAQNALLDGAIRGGIEDLDQLVEEARSWDPIQVSAPWTTRFNAFSIDRDRVILHFVNFNRDEGETREERGAKPENERPIPEDDIEVRWLFPRGLKSVKLYTPETKAPVELPFSEDGTLSLTIPEIRVYGVVEIEVEPESR